MTDARWQQIKALFQATVERPPAEREAFLAAATTHVPDVRFAIVAMTVNEVMSTTDVFVALVT